MTIIPVDYNAASESGALWLHFADTKKVLAEIQAQTGDHVWVSDGEVLVGAQLKDEPVYGLVAIPHWQTVVNLDDYVEVDWPSLLLQLRQVLQIQGRSRYETAKLFQLLTAFDRLAPAELKANLEPGSFLFRAAGAVRDLGEPELAFTLLEQALMERPSYPPYIFSYLQQLDQIDPDRARVEATERAQHQQTNAVVLAACINILAAMTDHLNDSEFANAVHPILNWIERFDSAPGRDQIRPAVLALVWFNQGILLLRLKRQQEATASFEQAHATEPTEPTFDRARKLKTYDDDARDLEAQFRRKLVLIAA